MNKAPADHAHARHIPPVIRCGGVLRDNLEGLLSAIVLVLIIRCYVFEPFRIPTCSMAPTLLGDHQSVECPNCDLPFDLNAQTEETGAVDPIVGRCPNCSKVFEVRDNALYPPRPRNPVADMARGFIFKWRNDLDGGNRVIVNKYRAEWETPARWNIVVFKHQGRHGIWENYIKRLVGLPGETIQIRHGDIYINGEIARKPDEVQANLWQIVHDSRYPPEEPLRPAWERVHGASEYDKGDLVLEPDEAGRAEVEYAPHILDFPAYNGQRGEFNEWGGSDLYLPVGDLKLDVTVRMRDAGSATLHIIEDDNRYTAVIGFGAGDTPTMLLANDEVLATDPLGCDPAAPHRIVFTNVDGQLTLDVDGQRLFEQEVVITLAEVEGVASRSGVALGCKGSPARFSQVRLYRDLYYVVPASATDLRWQIPERNYYVLGDNTRKSSDSRIWGTFPEELLIGSACVVWWPLSDLRAIPER